jgi:large subunit ribosomal protein L5
MTLKERYTKEIRPALMKELGIKNVMAVPKVKAVAVAIGLSPGLKEPKFMDITENTLLRITGQRPEKTKAKVSISNFKVRKGMVIGMRVTLRGARMWDFLDKLLNVTFPRVRDFRGLPRKLIDASGNVSVGFREFLPFPEVRPDEVERVHGLEVTITTNAGDKIKGAALLKALGFPFKD